MEVVAVADPKAPLGSTEIELLRYIGDHPAISVGEVAEHVAQTTGQARTTVLTIMERLRKKGYLTRKQIAGVYRYSLKATKHDCCVVWWGTSSIRRSAVRCRRSWHTFSRVARSQTTT